MIVKVDKKIIEIQNNSLIERRNKTNKLCRDKISSGPILHNLTSMEIPENILNIIRTGLHIVPNNQHDLETAKGAIIKDLKKSAIS